MKKLPDEQKVTREIHDLEQVQVFLNGMELYSLIVAVQLWKSTSPGKLDQIKDVAELTARKLHQAFIPCPNTYTLLNLGWNLESKPDSTPEKK